MRRRWGVGGLVLAGLAWWMWPSPEPSTVTTPSTEVPVPPAEAEDRTRRPAKGIAAPGPTRARQTPKKERTKVRLQCAIDPALAEVQPTGRAVLRADDGRMYRGPVHIESGRLVVPGVPRGTGRGQVTLAGHVRTELNWWMEDDGSAGCYLEPPAPAGAVTGQVVGLPRGAVATVMGCGTRTRVDADGGFFMEVPPEPCELRATRRDGPFMVRSDLVWVDPQSGQDVILDLDLPEWKAGGVGVNVMPHPEGVAVKGVMPDTPAEDAGLMPNDLILAVDGISSLGMTTAEFVDLAVGPEGTDVIYTVLRDGEEWDVVMAREAMERSERGRRSKR